MCRCGCGTQHVQSNICVFVIAAAGGLCVVFCVTHPQASTETLLFSLRRAPGHRWEQTSPVLSVLGRNTTDRACRRPRWFLVGRREEIQTVCEFPSQGNSFKPSQKPHLLSGTLQLVYRLAWLESFELDPTCLWNWWSWGLHGNQRALLESNRPFINHEKWR